MSRRLRSRVGTLAVTATLLTVHAHAIRSQTVREGLILDHVTVVDVRTGRLLPDRAVVILGDTIADVVPAGSASAPAGLRRVDVRGSFVTPGFNDMHAHNLNTESPATSLPLMLANGITGFRQMAGAPPLLAARQGGQTLLPADSPALLVMSGAILAGPAFADPAAVRNEVGRQKAQGADFIKAVDLPPAAFLAAADAARANGLALTGHLPVAVDARAAMQHGMASIEHLGPGISVLLNCSGDEATIRKTAATEASAAGPDFGGGPAQVSRMLANPILTTPPDDFVLMRRVLATYDDRKCRAFARDVAASETWMVPTLTRLEAMQLGNTPALRDNPDLRYVPAASRALWAEVGADFDRRLTAEQRQVLSDLFEAQLRLVGVFGAAGVHMMAGTDFGGGWIVPGFSLHREFDLLARAGLQPLRILQMTTVDVATFLHRERHMGTVEAGKAADLVLLQGDPTASVANLHRITGVVRAGRYFDRPSLGDIEARAVAALR